MRTLRPNSDAPNDIIVRFKAAVCDNPKDDGAVCGDVEVGNEYEFDVSVTVNSCPPKEDWGKERK